MGHDVQLDEERPLQLRQEASHTTQLPVLLSPYMLVPQELTHERPRRKKPCLHEEHCEGALEQILQAVEQLEHKRLLEGVQEAATYVPFEQLVLHRAQDVDATTDEKEPGRQDRQGTKPVVENVPKEQSGRVTVTWTRSIPVKQGMLLKEALVLRKTI